MKYTNKFDFNKLSQPIPQTILIIISSILLILLTIKPFRTFKNLDPAPKVIAYNINNQLAEVETGFFVNNFTEFDIIKNEFILDGVVWFKFDPTKISQEIIDNFSFSKGEFLTGEFLEKPKPKIQSFSDHETLAQYNVRIKFSSNLNYRLFPLDNHTIYITLNNKYLSGEKFYFNIDKDKFLISDSIYTFGWKKIAHHFKSGFSEFSLDKSQKISTIPRIVFSIDFMGSSFKNILLIFLPLFVVFFLSLFSFTLDFHQFREVIVTLSAASVPAILGYRFVIETVSPKVSYFMLSDHIFNLFLILSFLIFFFNTFHLQKLQKYSGILVLSFHIILIGAWYYLLYFWS